MTDEYQTCINRVAEAHCEKILNIKIDVWDSRDNVKTAVLEERSGPVGMKSNNFGTLQPGQYLIVNHNNWTFTVHDKKTTDDND